MMRLTVFLNHLCDGEPLVQNFLVFNNFLNHLCDGELDRSVLRYNGFFLNHLCDGEQRVIQGAQA